MSKNKKKRNSFSAPLDAKPYSSEKLSLTKGAKFCKYIKRHHLELIAIMLSVISLYIASTISCTANNIALKTNPINCELTSNSRRLVVNNNDNILYSADAFSVEIQKGEYSGDYYKIIFALANDNMVDFNVFTKDELSNSNQTISFSNGQFGLLPKQTGENTIDFFLSLMENDNDNNLRPVPFASFYIIFQSINGEYYYFPAFYYCTKSESESSIQNDQSQYEYDEILLQLFSEEDIYNRTMIQLLLDELNRYIDSDYTVDTFTSQIESELALIRSKLES